MDNVKRRPDIVDFNCPTCRSGLAITPVFWKYEDTVYEAWAKWFPKENTTPERYCVIIYEGQEFLPSRACKEITGGSGKGWHNGWDDWKYKSDSGIEKTLRQLAREV